MKQVVIRDIKQSDIIDVPDPKAKADWAVVKILAAPMCTEYKQYYNGQVNLPLGHEAAGVVVDAGPQSECIEGERVVVMPQYPCGRCSLCLAGEYIHCQDILNYHDFTGQKYGNATYAQYILKPSWLLPQIPDDISIEHGSMLCCGLGPTFGALQRMQVEKEDVVLITGLGPVGLGGIINSVSCNARVLGITNNSYRAKLALELGAESVFPANKTTLEQIKEYTEGKGADKSMECAGHKDAQRLLVNATRRNGKIAFIGESGAFKLLISEDLMRNGLTLYGIWHYNYKGIDTLFKILRNNKEKINKMITHYFTLNQVAEAWEVQNTRQCGKVILKPWN